MAAYDLSTSYRSDYELADWIESVTWETTDADNQPNRQTGIKAQFRNFDTPELQSLAASIGLTNEAAAVVVWQPTPTNSDPAPEGQQSFVPRDGDFMRRESKAMEGWIVKAATRSRFGHWLLACEREVTNA